MSLWSQSLVSSRLQCTVIILLVNGAPCLREINNKAEDALGDDESDEKRKWKVGLLSLKWMYLTRCCGSCNNQDTFRYRLSVPTSPSLTNTHTMVSVCVCLCAVWGWVGGGGKCRSLTVEPGSSRDLVVLIHSVSDHQTHRQNRGCNQRQTPTNLLMELSAAKGA